MTPQERAFLLDTLDFFKVPEVPKPAQAEKKPEPEKVEKKRGRPRKVLLD